MPTHSPMQKKPLKIDDTAPSVPIPTTKVENHDGRVAPREYARDIISRFLFVDLVVAFAAIVTVGSLYTPHSWGVMSGIAAFGALLFIATLSYLKTYDIRNIYRIYRVLGNIGKSAGAWMVVMYTFTHFSGYDIPNVLTGVALVAVLSVWRLAAMVFWVLRARVRTKLRSRTVVIGWTEMAQQLHNSAKDDITADFEVVGCVPVPNGILTTLPPSTIPVLGRYMELLRLIEERKVDSVILAEHLNADELQGLVTVCQRSYIDFHVIPSGFPTLRTCLDVSVVNGVPMVGYGSLPLDKVTNRVIKRAMDIAGAIVGLIIAAPFIFVFALCVYIESPGPVIYKQRRSTRGGKSFWIYKIRSMKLNAESGSGAVWCKKEDDRRLKVGALMRKTNVDELPQFWNVLKGDMSLVGPRPERPELIAKFKHDIDNYNARHMAKAGLTGWAAINGWRGDTDLSRRIEADVYYLENWSISLDLYCIFATMFKIKNAY